MFRATHAILVVTLIVVTESPLFGQPKLVKTLDLGIGNSSWGGVFHLQYSDDGKWVVSIHGLSYWLTATQWSVSDGKKIAYADFGELAVIHPDGNTVAYDGIKGPIRLWDLAKRKASGSLNHQGQVIDATDLPQW